MLSGGTGMSGLPEEKANSFIGTRVSEPFDLEGGPANEAGHRRCTSCLPGTVPSAVRVRRSVRPAPALRDVVSGVVALLPEGAGRLVGDGLIDGDDPTLLG